MDKKKKINYLYFIEHLSVKEISQSINVSSAYITKIIKQDSRYVLEKEYRKNLSKNKRKIAQKDFAKTKREHKRIEDNYLVVLAQHNQASRELSISKHINNSAFRKWNSSAYTYNPSKKRYELDSKLVSSYAVPKYIKERY